MVIQHSIKNPVSKRNFTSSNTSKFFKNEEIRNELLERTPVVTVSKLMIALCIIAACNVFIMLRERVPLPVPLVTTLIVFVGFLLGCTFAHITELQHELLHSHAFRSHGINRFLGFICGMFMLSSYSHYRDQHLLHHRYIGTEKNTEFFEYPKTGLDGFFKLFYAAINPSRFLRVGRLMINGFFGVPVAGLSEKTVACESSQEYAWYGVMVASAVAYTALSGNMLLVYSWVLPLFLVAEPIHYLIELPEHFALDAFGDTDIFKSTRSIKASWFWWYFTNGNNLHVAHHCFSRVPMSKTRRFQNLVEDKCIHVEESYYDFYRKIVSGELVPFDNGRPTLN